MRSGLAYIILVVKLYLKLQCESQVNVCNDAYVLVKGTITITGAGADVAAKQAHERSKYYLKIVHQFPSVWTK